MKICTIVFMLLVAIVACHRDDQVMEDIAQCDNVILNQSVDYSTLLDGLGNEFLLQAVAEPDALGALGRNKEGYFHVRFQLDMTRLTDAAVALQREDALEAFLRNLKYSFSHQEANGGFELRLPENLVGNLEARPGDLASGAAFFGYSLGLSLTTLENSDWYVNNSQTATLREAIQEFNPKIRSALEYLKTNVDVLEVVDAEAPNRLLFDAIAFYSLGMYLNDDSAMETGIQFLNKALALVNEEFGYFIEGGGWDSSYNGVAIKLGMELYALLPDNHLAATALRQRLTCATLWQASRVLESGEISTEGNTRVFPGGESFLGNEKAVDAEKTIWAFLYFAVLTDNKEYEQLANKILGYYG